MAIWAELSRAVLLLILTRVIYMQLLVRVFIDAGRPWIAPLTYMTVNVACVQSLSLQIVLPL